MGSCISVRKSKGAVLAESLPGFRSPGPGSKDEMFFESQEWLESDCEDDFFSVNGDSTPSHGNTPNYQTGTLVGSQRSKSFNFDGYTDTGPETSLRKKLAELLQETLPAKPAENEHGIVDRVLEVNGKSEGDATKMDHPPKSSDGTPHLSGKNSVCGDDRTHDASIKKMQRVREGKRSNAAYLVCSIVSASVCKKHTPNPSQ